MEDLLSEHFEFELDDRYHCHFCNYNSQLPNKAMAHLQIRHGDQLAPTEQPEQPETGQEPGQEPEQDQEPEKGQEPGQEPDGWQQS